MMRMSSVRPVLGILMLAGAVAAAACSGGEAAPSSPPSGGGRGGQNAQAVPVTAAPVVQKSVPLSVQGIGTVIAASTVTVRAQVTGELTAVHFLQGHAVKERPVNL